MLELHVYPPAFSLPSIDAHCVATIAYFSAALPESEYRLIADTPNNNPTGELPALRNGSIWIAGFANIVDYIRKLNREWDLDARAELEDSDRADLIAYTALITSRGQDLLDLSLYLSSVNYSAITRKTFSTFLPFPLSWVLPHNLRAGAKARTAHLGLSSLDIDSEEQLEEDKNPVPESLRTKTGPSSILSSPENAAQIRLHGLARAFLAPLQELRGQDRFFIGDRPTTLDCLAMGYLSLCLFPDLPSSWLAGAIRNEFPMLGAFVHDMQQLFFHGVVGVEDCGIDMSGNTSDEEQKEREKKALGKEGLPWAAPPERGFVDLARTVGGHLVGNVPVVSDVLKARRIQRDLEEEAERDPERAEELALEHHRAGMFKKELLMSVGSVALGLGLFVTFLVKQGVLAAIVGNIEQKVRRQEQEEQQFSWDTNSAEEEYVPSGLSNLASQMDFMGDMEFGAPQPNRAEVSVEADVVPDRTL